MSDPPPPTHPTHEDGPERSTSLTGRVIAGKFRMEKPLGGGSMGEVYKASWIALDKTVAIKVMHGALATDPLFVARFEQEAKAVSRFDHPNSIRLLDFGAEPDGLLYIAMEYVAGQDLFTLLSNEWPLSTPRVIDILSQVLAALAAAHDMGVFHRDMKPENILLQRRTSDEGRDVDVVRVCDFGIAKILGADDPAATVESGPRGRKLTTAGLVVGTPDYMSPEQARGGAVDGRSDLYSVGIILFELLTGRVPFHAPSPLDVVMKHVNEAPLRPSRVRPGVDLGLEAVCLRAIAKSPAERFQSAREMRTALRAAAGAATSEPQLPDLEGAALAIAAPEVAPLAAPDSDPGVFARRQRPTSTSEGATLRAPVAVARRPRPWWALAALAAALVGTLLWLRAPHKRDAVATPPASSTPMSDVSGPPPMAVPSPGPTWAALPLDTQSAAATAESHPAKQSVLPSHATRAVAVTARHTAELVPPVAPPISVAAPPPEALGSPPPVAPPPTAPSTPAATAPPSPAPRTFDPAAARVEVGGAVNVVGTAPSSVNKALAGISGRFTSCYVAILPQLSSPATVNGTVRIETDEAGVITDARVLGPLAREVGSCFRTAVVGRRIANVDTGTASADVPLVYRPL